MPRPRTILITGCSEGGLGDALARALHQRGQRVIATGRNPAKIAHFKDLGIETLILDVQSQESISNCVEAVAKKTGGGLDMLINNSGGGYMMPLADANLDESRQVFELNVWAVLAVTQAFIPLLLKSEPGGVIVNNTSVSSLMPTPLSGIYNASKAAAAMLTDTLRLELSPFGLKVVELKTGAVSSRFHDNQRGGRHQSLPGKSLYNVAKIEVERIMTGEMVPRKLDSDQWAKQVAADLLATNPPRQIWKGVTTTSSWLALKFVPFAILDIILSKMTAMDVVKKNVNSQA
ncbi:NAD(P)-binding protein [Pleurostoma richardsiae]|uniref:NAD(P)-binding protein n=1 Tax=Pleurostoma richardsiae TaxID=41990 RepID=A0AA38VIX3_9PEZI|nr:NAD(P)-binding protein [Pleurostoma richardsiae]